MVKCGTVTAVGTAMIVCLAAASVALAEQQDVQKQIEELHRIIQYQQKEIGELKQKVQAESGGSLSDADRTRLAELVKEEVARATADSWFNKWSLKGDFRYRHEWINDGTVNDRRRPRVRHRVRTRVGAFAEVNDEWDVGVQIATGGGEPTSTNQTLDNWFAQKQVWWDLMYARYRPKQVKDLEVTFGRMKFPFYKAGGSDLIFDSDVNPEGIAFNYSVKAMENLTVFFNGGGFWVDERNFDALQNSINDGSLWAGQVYAQLDLPQIAKDVYVRSGVSYYNYGNVEGYPVEPFAGLAGNTGDIARRLNNRYGMDYDIWNPFVEVGFPVAKLPVKIYADLAVNSEAESPNRQPVRPGQVAPTLFADENNFGWMVGFQVGKASKPGQWQVSYDYRDLEPDAVLAALTDADFAGGGTDAKGHKVSLAYCLSKNVTVGATFFCDKQDIHTHGTGNDFYHRLQLDLMVKF